jgi:hypothetical protein
MRHACYTSLKRIFSDIRLDIDQEYAVIYDNWQTIRLLTVNTL